MGKGVTNMERREVRMNPVVLVWNQMKIDAYEFIVMSVCVCVRERLTKILISIYHLCDTFI